MKRLFPVLFTFILFIPAGLEAQLNAPSFEDTIKVYEGLFDEKAPLHLTLPLRCEEFPEDTKDEKYQPAEMICHVNETFQVNHPVRLKARGIYRSDHCSTPPFWLNIRYSDIEAEELRGIRKMKMVTRCREGKSFEDYILREYLVYKIYNLITPYSFRTRLVRLKYMDTGRDNKESEDWAFLIEPDDLYGKKAAGQDH